MIITLLADGFEEIEALTPVDMLRRAGFDIKTVSINEKNPVGSHGIEIKCDATIYDIDINRVEAVIFPGGMPGATNLDACPFTDKVISHITENGGYLAAICAAPLILGRRGLLAGKNATCYPGFEGELSGANVLDRSVVRDGNIITARGMGVALEFAEELIRALKDDATARKISKSICKESALAEDSSDEENKEYVLPDISILSGSEVSDSETDGEVEKLRGEIENFYLNNSIKLSFVNSTVSARIIKFEFMPEKATKLNKILNLVDDLALTISKFPIRITAFSDKGSAIIEIPRNKSISVDLKGLLDTEEFRNSSLLTVCLGKDTDNCPVYADIAKMPHLIVSGATGMGKSVALSSIITSILCKATPDEVKLILIDPKMVEFWNFKNIPNLLLPILHDAKEVAGTFEWLISEVDRRYSEFVKLGVRNIDAYNKKAKELSSEAKPMENVVIIIDELADLMMMDKNNIESGIMRIAQKARAAGIHLIIGTQRPDSKVITSVIKTNIPSRLCFKVVSRKDSNTILDQAGGELLLGRGDALLLSPGSYTPKRLQGCYISDDDITKVAEDIRNKNGNAKYDSAAIDFINEKITEASKPKRKKVTTPIDTTDKQALMSDEAFLASVELALEMGKISTSMIQRKTCIGYGRAARYLDAMEEMGIVSELDGQKPRTTLITREDWLKMLTDVD